MKDLFLRKIGLQVDLEIATDSPMGDLWKLVLLLLNREQLLAGIPGDLLFWATL